MNLTKEQIKNDYQKKLINLFAEDLEESSVLHQYIALAELVKEYSFERWMKTNKKYKKEGTKQVYYFSMEFLLGKLLENNLINLGIKDIVEEALMDLGVRLEELNNVEREAGLGNGGLGRLAACFLDSMAALSIAGHGNGIRYKYGFFRQQIRDGYQVETPDDWLRHGYPWEIRRVDKSVIVKFGGYVYFTTENGRFVAKHEGYEEVLAVPYDVPIIGYGTDTVNTLRLWNAEVKNKDFDFERFSAGEYTKAIEYKYSVESISQVLYPDDTTEKGKLLRLKQEYFFVSAGVQSIMRTYKKMGHSIYDFHKYVAIHINDTHPALAVAELMRILIDEEQLPWEDAWDITVKTMAYTNHTIMSEALEKWPVDMMKKLLPRIYTIIEEINRRFCQELMERYNNDWNKVDRMAIISGGWVKMANLAIVGSHSVNGVSKLHTEILKNQELRDFNEYYQGKFNNKTNGITHRRWLIKANPDLTNLIANTIGCDFLKNPKELIKLEDYKDDKAFLDKLAKIKYNNKAKLADYIRRTQGIKIDPNSIFDVQAKRLHAYKRQLLNILHVINLYNELIDNPNMDIVPHTFIFSAKAAPGYYLAKKIIKLINSVGEKVNNDPKINNRIKVVFAENYNVSLAEKLIPSAEVSEQISTASKEASGTGNMKFMMNGAITIGTLDGANVEIYEEVGDENIILFGMTSEEVINYYKNGGYHSWDLYYQDRRLTRILNELDDGYFAPKGEFREIFNHLLTHNDEFFVLKDFASYCEAQRKINELYKDKLKWNRISLINIAHSGRFSSDNTILEYARDIWFK
ncbi:glycogen/starch/alpha-glucan phosphorylase [Caloramator proteoclasticus]|uniref:Alpha-1,4 glucan phosphorylase n=1 Tax=Caloramator proteoclasticus DSM 10124 TaxID=1121262 RepID=A0A1M4XY31_9CLOT|nr:glycogen/starch/alpha-glucan phosphorylase [Caloramator proteoclasticus]SHE98223.1 starch phosphorylase [Caloramator proteoclasticus DSM 10124]